MDDHSHANEGLLPGRTSASRRERELRRYGEAVLALRNSKGSIAAKSSIDVPLTAFAQLVALRLNAKRALISLYDKNSQYVLAEATQTLSLQQDYVHDEGDALHWGSAILKRADDFSGELLQLARKSRTEDGMCGKRAALVVPDLKGDSRFVDHAHVVKAPFARCFAGVPLFTPSGFALGTLSILDDKPRPEGLSEPEIAFLRDVATTVMTHLEMARVQKTHERGMRMVQGLSRFMEGKASVDDDRIPSDEDLATLAELQSAESATLGASTRTQALNHATNQERISDARDRFFEKSQAYSHGGASHQPVALEAPPNARSTSLAAITKVRRKKLVTRHSVQPKGRPARPGTPTQLQEDIVSADVERAFQRAALIIQQSMDMAGVLFLDASVGEWGNITDGGGTSSDGSDYDSVAPMDGEKPSSTADSYPLRLKPCRYLATAYQDGDDEDRQPDHRTIPEKFLRGLMKRYPHGKIYNFGDDGVLSSSEQSDDSPPSPEYRRRAWSDSVKILSIFPGVRSLAVMPLWDATRGRFFAATVAWSYNHTRLFSFQDDMNYLACCCDVVMAEVGRLDIQADVHAKTSFISSVSHELRSPLQGILGGVECLQEELSNNDPTSRQQMVQMIDTCGRGLLDIINNLLEHAHSSSSGNSRRPGVHRRRGAGADAASHNVHDLAVLVEEILDSALWSTPRPSALSSGKACPEAMNAEAPSLRVILDVDVRNLPPTGWNFHVNSGAFRRILQNLTMNAIKYTDPGGYYKVTLSMDKGVAPPMVKISCTDSGRGMSEEFLKYGLWQAFKQEDSHTPGTGLGLSLVRSLVHEMGGTISLKSVKDVGTTIKLCLPLTAGNPSDVHNLRDLTESVQIKGLTFSLMGFRTTSPLPRVAEASGVQRSSIDKACKYLGLVSFDEQTKRGRSADILIITERAARRLAESGEAKVQASHAKACLVFCDSVTAARAAGPLCKSLIREASAVSQPCGPQQLLRALVACLDKYSHAANQDSLPGIRIKTNEDHATAIPKALVSRLVPSKGAVKVSASIEITARPLTRKAEPISDSTVLLVDDNPINLTLLRRSIKRLGRIDLCATNGQEALLAYKESHAQPLSQARRLNGKPTKTAPVRFILTDITMPVMDGLEFTRRVRAHERALDLKPAMIVALTALSSPAARQEAFGSGVDLFLSKPFTQKQIAAIFADWELDQSEDGE